MINAKFRTDGFTLLIEHMGTWVCAANGQAIFTEFAEHCDRIEFDPESEIARRFYPWVNSVSSQKKLVMVDPDYSFGRPAFVANGVAITPVVDRYLAGESISELCLDYGCESEEIEEAIRFRLRKVA